MNTYDGQSGPCDGRFAVVVSRFNESITARLLDGAVQTLLARGVAEDRIDVVWVPGAFEIPTAAARLAASGRYAAVLCLGAVIRGETSHDQHINRAVSIALAQLGTQYKLPVLFGVLTCNTLQQAIARSGHPQAGTRQAGTPAATTGKDHAQARLGNKGVDCAEAALEMVRLLAKLPPA
ncbi:MAG: 6,7-dimethyl-8-ribityllumazine synthase [Thermoguttaceae bacterium]